MKRFLYAEDILGLPEVDRRRLRLKRLSRKRDAPRDLSRDELVDHLQAYEFTSVRKLRKGHKEGHPTEWDYLQEFGSWNEAKLAAFGEPETEISPTITAEYMMKVVIEFNLWSWRKYIKAHNKSPKTIPSTAHIRRLFGSWGTLKSCAESSVLKECMAGYGRLTRRMGRTPTIREAEMDGVAIRTLIQWFDGKKKNLDDFIVGLEGHR